MERRDEERREGDNSLQKDYNSEAGAIELANHYVSSAGDFEAETRAPVTANAP
jgi:hypothetical protein